MKIVSLSNQAINNPIYAQLTASASVEQYNAKSMAAEGDLLVFDAASYSPEDVSKAIASLDAGASVLFLDVTDAHKKVFAGRIGFRSEGNAYGYYVAKANDGGREFYRIIEAKNVQVETINSSQSMTVDEAGEKTLAQPEQSTEMVSEALSEEQAQAFVGAISTAPAEAKAMASNAPPDQLIWKNWYYSRSHAMTASGSKSSNDLGPPPTNSKILLSLNYQFQAALNNATQTSPFQYLGMALTGVFQNGGMSASSDEAAGWILTQLGPEAQVPPNELFWYSSEPATANNVTTVTTGSSVTVGFDASADTSGVGAGANASYTYSNSTTKNITDWYVKQSEATKWQYAQAEPFDGAGNWRDGGFHSFSGTVQYSYLPAISTSSLQFAVNAVWKTNTVLRKEVGITCYNPMWVGYLMANKIMGVSTKNATWYSYSNPSDVFYIDLTVVS